MERNTLKQICIHFCNSDKNIKGRIIESYHEKMIYIIRLLSGRSDRNELRRKKKRILSHDYTAKHLMKTYLITLTFPFLTLSKADPRRDMKPLLSLALTAAWKKNMLHIDTLLHMIGEKDT